GQQQQDRDAKGQEQEFLETEAPAGLLDAGEQELHGRPRHRPIAAAVEEVQRDRDAGGQGSPEHERCEEGHCDPTQSHLAAVLARRSKRRASTAAKSQNTRTRKRRARYSVKVSPSGRDVSISR